MYNSNKIDRVIQTDAKGGMLLNSIRDNTSKKMFDSHNSRYNILIDANGRKLAVKNVYTFKGGNIVKSCYLEMYYICKEDENKLYYLAYTKENSKGLNTYRLPYMGEIML